LVEIQHGREGSTDRSLRQCEFQSLRQHSFSQLSGLRSLRRPRDATDTSADIIGAQWTTHCDFDAGDWLNGADRWKERARRIHRRRHAGDLEQVSTISVERWGPLRLLEIQHGKERLDGIGRRDKADLAPRTNHYARRPRREKSRQLGVAVGRKERLDGSIVEIGEDFTSQRTRSLRRDKERLDGSVVETDRTACYVLYAEARRPDQSSRR
jgi:hypothetical protein